MRVAAAVEALKLECELVSEVVLGLDEAQFGTPTRCAAWNVKELLAHMYRDVERTIVGLHEEAPGKPDTDAVTYWRSYDPKADAPSIADRAKLRAASYGSGHELAVAWDDMWRRSYDLAMGQPPLRPILTWGPILTLDDFLTTRTVEIAVHGLDMADALGLDGWATQEAVGVTTTVLEGILGESPSPDLGWGPLTFIEKGTGRQQLTHGEQEILGRLAGRFPLLS
jgi:uncharacterized protein (TIGR03083 family)